MEVLYEIFFPIGNDPINVCIVILGIVWGIVQSRRYMKREKNIVCPKEINDATVLVQIEMMQSKNCTVLDTGKMEMFYNKNGMGGFAVKKQEWMDYYNTKILPATNVSQELKDAWIYQAKRSGIWK